jgi:hypothetical protein
MEPKTKQETIMAVNESATPPYARLIMQHLDPTIKEAAFRASNPVLSSELVHMATNPARIKKLAVNSAVEIVELLDDIIVIQGIGRIDQRVAVQDAVRTRLRQCNIAMDEKQLAKASKQERTTGHTTKEFTVALNALVREGGKLDTKVVREWMLGLDESQVLVAASRLLDTSSFYSDEESRTIIERHLLTSVTTLVAKEHWKSVQISDENVSWYLSELSGEISGFLATQISATSYGSTPQVKPKDGSPHFVASDDAIEVWVEDDALTLLIWTESITAEKAATKMKVKEINWDIPSAARSKHYAEVLITRAKAHGWFDTERNPDTSSKSWWRGRNETQLGRLYDVVDLPVWIQKEIAFLSKDEHLLAYLFNRYVNQADPEVISEVVSTFEPASVESLFKESRHDNYLDDEEDESVTKVEDDQEHVTRVMRAFVKGVKGLPEALQPSPYSWRWNRENILYPHVASYLTEVLGENERAWGTFWGLTASTTKETTFEMLALASAALGS